MASNDDPVISTLHQALTAIYGSETRRDLNRLTVLLRRMALSACGLEFLLHCRRHNVFPNFITNSFKFSQAGDHLCRLVEKLLAQIRRAAIKDSCECLAETQCSVDNCWRWLSASIKENTHWDILVAQKDTFYTRTVQDVSLRLRWKFTALFAGPPNSTYALANNRSAFVNPETLVVQPDHQPWTNSTPESASVSATWLISLSVLQLFNWLSRYCANYFAKFWTFSSFLWYHASTWRLV